MGGVVKGLFGGGPKVPSGPTAAELEAQRKAEEAERERKEDAQQKQSREAAAKNRTKQRRAGVASTIATGSSGLTTTANVASGGLKDRFGQ